MTDIYTEKIFKSFCLILFGLVFSFTVTYVRAELPKTQSSKTIQDKSYSINLKTKELVFKTNQTDLLGNEAL